MDWCKEFKKDGISDNECDNGDDGKVDESPIDGRIIEIIEKSVWTDITPVDG